MTSVNSEMQKPQPLQGHMDRLIFRFIKAKLTVQFALALTLVVIILATAISSPGHAESRWQEAVDPLILAQVEKTGEAEFILFLNKQADLSEAKEIDDKVARREYVYRHLLEVANQTQPEIINILEDQATDYQPFWITNMIWVKGKAELLADMALRTDIAYIHANPSIKQSLPNQSLTRNNPTTSQSVPWNIEMVSAPDVWDQGFTGQGAVVGGQDTGYEWNHPAIISQYRGTTGTGVDHNYNWHDAIHENSTRCPPDSKSPCDGHGHGTHTMGTMVGDDGQGNQIGMAPGAKWIGCRNMNDYGIGSPVTYSECYQWFIAPTDLDGANPDPSKGPDVINNSWSCTDSEGCSDPNILLTVVQNVRAAGILTVHSAGNRGPNCGTVDFPAAIYDDSYTVGATTSADVIWSGSSRGPVIVDGSNRLKPDVSAPGTSIFSSTSNGGYGYMSGTSMAGPHVAGLAALLISAEPQVAGKVDLLEETMNASTLPKFSSQSCGGIQGNVQPNNTYGYGRIDALLALYRLVPPDPAAYFPTVLMAKESS